MKKILLVLFVCFSMTQAKDLKITGEYLSFMGGDGSIVYITFKVDGKARMFDGVSFDKEVFEKHRNEDVVISYEHFDGGDILNNVYFKDGTNANNEKESDMLILDSEGNEEYYVRINGIGENCEITLNLNGIVIKTDCLRLANSKKIKILCTKKKKMCKTEKEVQDYLITQGYLDSKQISKSTTSSIKVNTIESADLLKMFALDESINYTIYNWKKGSEESSPIIWRYNGIKPTITRKDYSYEKRGDVYVVNQKKVTHETASNKIVNSKWQVVLLGARGGYFNVEIDPEFYSHEPAALAIDKKYIIKEKHCEESASENTSMYLIKFTGKKTFWLKENFSSGSAGGSYSYKIMYGEVPKCMR